MASKGPWRQREKTLESGTVVRWREREVEPGVVERVFEGDQVRTSAPVVLRAA